MEKNPVKLQTSFCRPTVSLYHTSNVADIPKEATTGPSIFLIVPNYTLLH